MSLDVLMDDASLVALDIVDMVDGPTDNDGGEGSTDNGLSSDLFMVVNHPLKVAKGMRFSHASRWD